VLIEGEYLLGHVYLSVTFGTLENYRTEFLRFEVAHFDCGYNVIIGRPGLAKFMAIPHYPYMILKMPGPQGITTVRVDFQGVAECFRGTIQTALTVGPPVAHPAQAGDRLEDENLMIPLNKAQVVTFMRLTEETKRINMGFSNERKTSIIRSSLATNRKARLSSSCKIIEMYSHGNLRTCLTSRENWPSTNLKYILRQDRSDRSCIVSRLIREKPFVQR
jgi:hypothetical protein